MALEEHHLGPTDEGKFKSEIAPKNKLQTPANNNHVRGFSKEIVSSYVH